MCIHKDIIKEVNKILFNFIWKVKNKVKRSVLISDEETGGLRAPHLESIIRTQRIMCCKKFAEAQQSSWKMIISHYLKQDGGKLVLACRFDLKKRPVKLPRFYKECLPIFAEHSAGMGERSQILNNNTRANTMIWNNKDILINGPSIFYFSLFNKGIVTLKDIVTDKDDVIIKQNLNESIISPMEVFYLMQILDALSMVWRNSFVLSDYIQPRLKNMRVGIDKAVFMKNVYKEIRAKCESTPTAQKKFTDLYSGLYLDWHEINKLPFKVLVDTKSREFQYRILNRYLVTNAFLCK